MILRIMWLSEGRSDPEECRDNPAKVWSRLGRGGRGPDLRLLYLMLRHARLTKPRKRTDKTKETARPKMAPPPTREKKPEREDQAAILPLTILAIATETKHEGPFHEERGRVLLNDPPDGGPGDSGENEEPSDTSDIIRQFAAARAAIMTNFANRLAGAKGGAKRAITEEKKIALAMAKAQKKAALGGRKRLAKSRKLRRPERRLG